MAYLNHSPRNSGIFGLQGARSDSSRLPALANEAGKHASIEPRTCRAKFPSRLLFPPEQAERLLSGNSGHFVPTTI